MTTSVRRSKVRPARPFSPIFMAVVVLFIWWVVAHNSGSGWVQVLGDAVFGTVAVGLLGPALVLATVRVVLIHAPSDGAAGKPAVVALGVSARARVRSIDPPGPEAFLGPRRGHVDHEVTLLPTHRGCHGSLEIEVATAAPFGLQWWSRRFVLELRSPLQVAPRLGRPFPLPIWLDERTGREGSATPAEAGEARGVRNYRPGDRRRRIHWVATAHTGRLMVREMEQPSSQPVTLRVNLPAEPEAAELVAEQALGTVVRLIDRGTDVVLATIEPSGAVARIAADRREAGRRMARAIGGTGSPGVHLLP